jgi:hypothetical protein
VQSSYLENNLRYKSVLGRDSHRKFVVEEESEVGI